MNGVVTRRPRSNFGEVLRELEHLHTTLRAGDCFPSRRELVGQLGTSERAVRDALDRLEEQGKIIRRVGRGGSVVAKEELPAGEGTASPKPGAMPSGDLTQLVHPVLAVGEPDGGVFDQAMRFLMKRAKSAKLDVHCRFTSPQEMEGFPIPPATMGARDYVVFRRHFLPLAERLKEAGHRVVFVGTLFTGEQSTVPRVFGDQSHGGYIAVNHLLELGHRRIAFHFAKQNYAHLLRWRGCQWALEEARETGLVVETQLLDWPEVSGWKQNPELLRNYLSGPGAPTAIISWNDDTAIELMTLLLSNGIRIPDDISLIGYDNLPRARTVHPALTTVDGALETQIRVAMQLLLEQNLPASHQTVVTPTLIVRGSTAEPRRDDGMTRKLE